jgi:fructose/tagatose bisphosphate aldolase
MLVSLRRLLDHAAVHDYGFGAFNINDKDQIRAIMEAADAGDSPAILQATVGARTCAAGAVRREMTHRSDKFVPRKWLAVATLAARAVCGHRYEAFGPVGQATSMRRAAGG